MLSIKRTLTVVLSFLCSTLLVNSRVICSASGTLGDVDSDGVINVADAYNVLKYTSEKLDSNSNFDFYSADVDANGIVDSVDAFKIMQYCVGEINDFSSDNSEYQVNVPIISSYISSESFNITWSPVENADGYMIYRNGSVVEDNYTSCKYSFSYDGYFNTYGANDDVYNVYAYRIVDGEKVYSDSSIELSTFDMILNSAYEADGTIDCYDTTNSTTFSETKFNGGSFTVNNEANETIQKFIEENQLNDLKDSEKIKFVTEWIYENVEYASGDLYSKLLGHGHAYNIFEQKLGQCLQYNGALTSFISYLGYDANLIFLPADSSYGQHFTGQIRVKLCDETGTETGEFMAFRLETGNEGKGTPFVVFREDIETSDLSEARIWY